ncbi:MAG TPA: bacteriocin [Opitutaceae bacterium]
MKPLTASELQTVTGGITPLADFGQFVGGYYRGLFMSGNAIFSIGWGLGAAYFL